MGLTCLLGTAVYEHGHTCISYSQNILNKQKIVLMRIYANIRVISHIHNIQTAFNIYFILQIWHHFGYQFFVVI